MSGGTPLRNNVSYWRGVIPWVSAKDLKSDRIQDAALHISAEALKESATKIAPTGSLLILVRGMGLANGVPIAEVTAPVAFNQDIRAILPPKYIFPRFLQLALRTSLMSRAGEGVLSSAAHGTLKIDADALRQIVFPVPALREQQRIVGVLDEAFDGIAAAKANAEKNRLNARALFDSHLQYVFTQRGKGWRAQRLGDLSRINYGYTESASAEKVGPHFLRITDIQNNRVDWESVPYCPIDASNRPKYKLSDGDIVFARTGATTGKSYLLIDPPDAVFASYLIRVQLRSKELLPQFVNLFFQTHSYWDTIRAGVSGSTQGGFNATKLGELVIPYPQSIQDQEAIVAKFDSLTKQAQCLARIYERKLAALEALKKSLLHQAFHGAL